MGTDIHAFIEIDYSKEGKSFETEGQVYAFNCGELNIPRDYDLFNALSDGRNYHFEEEEIEQHCLYPSRGLPKYYSGAVESRYFHLVDDRESEFDKPLELYPSLSIITTKKADQWLQEGCSFLGDSQETSRDGKQAFLQRVSHPNWHSCSWLTLEEIYKSLKHYELDIPELHFEFRLVLNIMKEIEQEYGDGHTRLVFWFDN